MYSDEWSGSALFQFNREGVLRVGEFRAKCKADFEENYWFEFIGAYCGDSIYTIEKARKRFFDGQRVERGGKGRIHRFPTPRVIGNVPNQLIFQYLYLHRFLPLSGFLFPESHKLSCSAEHSLKKSYSLLLSFSRAHLTTCSGLKKPTTTCCSLWLKL